MSIYLQIANTIIANYVQANHTNYYPLWSGVAPRKLPNDGWGATRNAWLQEASIIIRSFESDAAVNIVTPKNEVEAVGKLSLSSFAEYLQARANMADARTAVANIMGSST
jgi:hypothetical protein